ncbi:MAG: hypothetical protein OEV07_16080, partial [Gammaproteobacteria bacterium]|nr:hypothetical protein [Gammaproteobacteria bacterium]
MASTEINSSFFGRLNRRLKGTGDSEPEQAKLRLAISFIVIGYVFIPWNQGETFVNTLTSLVGLMCIIYYTSALAIFTAIVIKPVPSQFRRICGAVLDMGLLSWL